MVIKNKKAWIKIVEAFIALIIISGVLVSVIVVKLPKKDSSQTIHEMQRVILTQVSMNESMREEVVQSSIANVNQFVNESLAGYWNYEIRICEINEHCSMTQVIESQIYSDEIMITSSINDYSPKKLKFFVWIK